jgi:hypothetical protein
VNKKFFDCAEIDTSSVILLILLNYAIIIWDRDQGKDLISTNGKSPTTLRLREF